MRGEQVGLQGGGGDGWTGGAGGGRGGFEGVNLAEQVAVPVKEGPVHGGGAGDAGHGDLGAVRGGAVERYDDALPAACGVCLASFPHHLGPPARRRGPGRRCGGGHLRASLAGEGVVLRTDGMPRDTARCLRITVTASSIRARSGSLSLAISPLTRPMSRRIRVISSSAGVASARAHSSTPASTSPSRSPLRRRSSWEAARAGP